ncbi:2-alkenal reductase [Serratia sp. CC22-02]|uniref:MDR family NADP-dependent oxidoreductase n=1 Tax=Serratia sp. CC22-02 TaxID=1378076 RepID=UPI002402F3BB|nr:NADP-dependent oxidoreductase [Serratia sp. CC22-02]SMP82413.1 2-alkenal reductase [Serratia sp. CC22-02]
MKSKLAHQTTEPRHNVLVHLVSRPQGEPLSSNFRFVESPLPTLDEGVALVENIHFSVDPYMRECMDGDWALNAPLEGRTIGRVIRSNTPELHVGDWVFHRQGWRTYAQVVPDDVRILEPVAGVPVTAWLSILGGTGLTAWVALTKIIRLKAGESLYISAAAGGVGTAAAQFATLLGAKRIVGSTRDARKAQILQERLGYTDTFVYQKGRVIAQLAEIIPDGIDVYLDNVGGEQLEAAINSLKEYGRVAMIGAVAQYSSLTPPAAPYNLFDVVGKSLTLQGFLVSHYKHLQPELENFIIPHIRSGKIVLEEDITRGFNNIVDAFLSMLKGGNMGKAIVSVV